eukprot:c8840_g1_i3.p1 GENE.c8840_g1_i3~~c8840_g1_i3.p1  ORF type:complete len:119 (-),score=42.70 c8840_g1_i3:220-576(-)
MTLTKLQLTPRCIEAHLKRIELLTDTLDFISSLLSTFVAFVNARTAAAVLANDTTSKPEDLEKKKKKLLLLRLAVLKSFADSQQLAADVNLRFSHPLVAIAGGFVSGAVGTHKLLTTM